MAAGSVHQSSGKTVPPASGADWIAVICSFAVIIVSRFVDRGDIAWLRISGAILGLAGLILALVPIFALRKHGRGEKGKNYMHTTKVVDHGIFALVRHPQYLGYMLFNVCFMLLSQHWLILSIGCIAITFFYIYARSEERHCEEKFGAAYREYMQRVPRINLLLGLVRNLGRRKQVG